MKKTYVIVTAGVLALALAAGLVAYGMHAGAGRRGPADVIAWKIDGLLDKVEATEDQRTRIEAVVDPLLARGGALRQAHIAAHDQMLAQWSAEAVDLAALHAIADARADEVRALLHEVVDGMVTIHDTLTPAQREQVRKELAALHAGMGPHGARVVHGPHAGTR